MRRISAVLLASICAVASFAQSNFKEKTVFKNDDVEFRQLDDHTWHGNGHGDHIGAILDGTMLPEMGTNQSLPFVVDKYGVKVNYGRQQVR